MFLVQILLHTLLHVDILEERFTHLVALGLADLLVTLEVMNVSFLIVPARIVLPAAYRLLIIASSNGMRSGSGSRGGVSASGRAPDAEGYKQNYGEGEGSHVGL